ncbi:DUF6233 domain-containing protein [Streptomyces sp. RB17]|uniref:DUF6233 domain-containing protein n=1 Tax=Streptomyces sp. RB17 TaxID=2585197 RepID=UPI002B21894A|nr:DUF6233 domain-containing protein [Streptomyces sp. RB17]
MSEEREFSRLGALRFARRVVEQQATREPGLIDRWIADEQRREAEERRGQERRPPTPDWLLEVGLNRTTRSTSTAATAGTPVNGLALWPQAEAMRALTDGVPACLLCRPDSELGVLD